MDCSKNVAQNKRFLSEPWPLYDGIMAQTCLVAKSKTFAGEIAVFCVRFVATMYEAAEKDMMRNNYDKL